MSVTLVHHFHSETCSIQNVCPGVNNMPLAISDGLIEVEAVEVEGHGGDAEGGKPDADNWPGCQEEMQAAAIVERRILENKAAKISMSCNDVVGFFFLPKLITVVLTYFLSRLSNKTRSDQASVHSTKQSPTKYAGNAQHMKRVHENIVLRLEDKHIVESSRDTEGHPIRKTTLSKGIYQKNSSSSSNRCAVSHKDPRAHT